jgi:hypothetical protein
VACSGEKRRTMNRRKEQLRKVVGRGEENKKVRKEKCDKEI